MNNKVSNQPLLTAVTNNWNIVFCINAYVCVGHVSCVEKMLLSRSMLTVLLIVYTKQLQGRRQPTHRWLRTIAVMENSLLETFNGTRRQQSRERGVYPSLLYSGSDLSRHGSARQPHLFRMIRAKDLLLLLSALSKQQKSHKDGSISPSYLCELLAAAEFFSEGAELGSDPLVGPVQFFGWKHGIFLCNPQYINVTPLRLDTLLEGGGGGGAVLGLHWHPLPFPPPFRSFCPMFPGLMLFTV